MISPILWGCERGIKPLNGPVVSINPTTASEGILEQICDSVIFVELTKPDSIIWGEAYHIKTYNNLLLIHDLYYTKTITAFNIKGQFITQLNKIGKGPGEYTDLESFAYLPWSNELVINDRNKGFHIYSFPDLCIKKTIKDSKPIINLEALNNELISVSDAWGHDNNYIGLQRYFFNTGRYKDLHINNLPASIELSYPNTFTFTKNEILYASPNTTTTIFSITKNETKPIYNIDFGEHNVPRKYWNEDEARDFEKALENNTIATWVQNVIIDNERLCFGFIFKTPQNILLAAHNRATGKSKLYSSIHLYPKGEKLPNPIGVYNGYFISILEKEDIQKYLDNRDFSIELPKTYKFARSLKNCDNPVLILFRLKI